MDQQSLGAIDGYRLFVGNMGSRMTDGELRAIVTPYGTVKNVYIVKDGITGLSCGYAFVRMTDGAQAARVVSELDGKRIDGHFLIVRPLF